MMIRKNVCKNVIMMLLLMMQSAFGIEPNTVIGCVTPPDYPGCSFAGPAAIAITPDGKTAYVCNLGGSVSVIDVESNTVIECVTQYSGCPFSVPVAIAITPDGKTAYVCNEGGLVSVIDVESNTVIECVTPPDYPGCPFVAPKAIAITPDGKTAYVCNIIGTVSVIDVESNSVIECVTPPDYPGCPFSSLWAIAITPDGKTAYVINQGSPSTVSVIDVASNTVIGCVGNTFEYCGFHSPYAIAITPDGTTAYVCNSGGGINNTGSVSIIDLKTNAVIGCVGDTFEYCGFNAPYAIAITPDGTTAYVCNSGSPSTVSIIDLKTNTVIGCVGNTNEYCGFNNPQAIAITPDGTKAYVGNAGDNSVSIIFIKAPIQPPATVSGCKMRNRFLLQTDYINNITWTAPTSGNVPVAYAIYRDPALTQLVATVPASSALQYYDHNRDPRDVYSYYIVSVDGNGNVSTANSVTVTNYC